MSEVPGAQDVRFLQQPREHSSLRPKLNPKTLDRGSKRRASGCTWEFRKVTNP